jgi:hypothetical protein
LRRAMRWARRTGAEDERMLARALFATLISIMFIIFTVSSILVVPTLYIVVLGIACAFTNRLQANARSPQRTAAT